MRFRVPENRELVFTDAVRGQVRFHTEVIGDPIIVRADGMPAYNFAVVVDDALMEITHVIRGEDHISNTPRQLLLYEALGFSPPAFAHLAMVLGPDHSPLSKRHGATSVAEFRAKGYLPEALVNYLALIGWSPRPGGVEGDDADELMPLDELARRFSLDKVGHSAGVFDEEKLAWANRHYLKIADSDRVAGLSVPYFVSAGISMSPAAEGLEFLASVVPIASISVDRLDQIPRRLSFLFDYDAARALQSPGCAGRDAIRGGPQRVRGAGGGARSGAAARSRPLSRRGERGARASPARRARRCFIRSGSPSPAVRAPRARPRGAGDRSRRGAQSAVRPADDHRLSRAGCRLPPSVA